MEGRNRFHVQAGEGRSVWENGPHRGGRGVLAWIVYGGNA